LMSGIDVPWSSDWSFLNYLCVILWFYCLHKMSGVRMNYSHFIMLTKDMVSLEAKGQTGAALAMSPILSS
jgi:hypothetical protein